ncbi:MAG: hypothetical protein NZM11_12680, partial [Anaerolineales bacterium]|nr:hypothetical protein [Anaerolineales bacterium]
MSRPKTNLLWSGLLALAMIASACAPAATQAPATTAPQPTKPQATTAPQPTQPQATTAPQPTATPEPTGPWVLPTFPEPADVTGDIITAGSSTVFPLTERMAERF